MLQSDRRGDSIFSDGICYRSTRVLQASIALIAPLISPLSLNPPPPPSPPVSSPCLSSILAHHHVLSLWHLPPSVGHCSGFFISFFTFTFFYRWHQLKTLPLVTNRIVYGPMCHFLTNKVEKVTKDTNSIVSFSLIHNPTLGLYSSGVFRNRDRNNSNTLTIVPQWYQLRFCPHDGSLMSTDKLKGKFHPNIEILSLYTRPPCPRKVHKTFLQTRIAAFPWTTTGGGDLFQNLT